MKTEMSETRSDQKKKSNPNQVKCFGLPLPATIVHRPSRPVPGPAAALHVNAMPPYAAVPRSAYLANFRGRSWTKLHKILKFCEKAARCVRDVKFEEMKGLEGAGPLDATRPCVVRCAYDTLHLRVRADCRRRARRLHCYHEAVMIMIGIFFTVRFSGECRQSWSRPVTWHLGTKRGCCRCCRAADTCQR